MLVVKRRKDETLKISEDITIRILDVSGQQVKIGIEAPKEMTVMRDDAKVVKQ